MDNMISLVTGAAGFIGSNLVDYLLEQGHTVVSVDNESANNEKFHWTHENGMALNVKGDITDYKFMKNVFTGVDYVFHLAAESRLQPAIENPIGAVEKNCVGTTVMLQCAREAGVKRFVYSSTSSAYGNNPYPNVETQPDDCLNPYSASKAAGEKFCKMYYDLYGLETIVLRYFNVFGERSPARGQYAPVIGIFERQKAAGEPLTLVGDGSQRRDFVHVKDVARANWLAATLPINNHLGEVFNIGSGNNYSIKEIADVISPNQVNIPERGGEMDTTLADITKAQSILNWKPEIDVLEWIQK
jgi:UDP-glucose 4-epimerase|tara:strand:+ start:1049 stop:1951 length:903 start_codon:yes stop_codon:yes gene_type:complete